MMKLKFDTGYGFNIRLNAIDVYDGTTWTPREFIPIYDSLHI